MFSLDYHADQAAPSGVGLLLVGHGTRDRSGLAEFRQLHHILQQKVGDLPVSACFLELARPDIATGIERLLAQKVGRIVVCPLLLFAAGHAKRDIPEAVSAVLSGTGIRTTQLPPLACHEQLLELSELRYQAAEAVGTAINADFCAENGPTPGVDPACGLEREAVQNAQTTLILVGRGSTDALATAEMRRFAAFRAKQQPGAAVEVCFYAMSAPGLRETLAKVAKSAAQRVIVQPHLLFSGAVLQGISRLTAEISAEAGSDQKWFLAAPLGPHPLLAAALWDLFQSAESL